jgi:hypothetical protein
MLILVAGRKFRWIALIGMHSFDWLTEVIVCGVANCAKPTGAELLFRVKAADPSIQSAIGAHIHSLSPGATLH